MCVCVCVCSINPRRELIFILIYLIDYTLNVCTIEKKINDIYLII